MTDPAHRIVLAIGSNLGDRVEALRAAIRRLPPLIEVESISPVYETSAAYVLDQPPFLNAALTATTRLAPLSLLWSLKNVEQEVGRLPTYRYGPRVIDIDIIFYGDEIFASSELNVPHLHMSERDFVLKPLADIAPGWKHPKTGLTVAQMLAALPSPDFKCLGQIL